MPQTEHARFCIAPTAFGRPGSPSRRKTRGCRIPTHLDTQAKFLFVRDARGRDKVALIRVDLGTGETSLLAEHDQADIGGVLNDMETREPIAYSVMSERLEYFALDPRVQPDLDFLAKQDIGDWFVIEPDRGRSLVGGRGPFRHTPLRRISL